MECQVNAKREMAETNHLVDRFSLWHQSEAQLRTDNYSIGFPGLSDLQTGVSAVSGYMDSSTGSDEGRHQSMEKKKIMEVEFAKLLLPLEVRC